MRRAALGAMFVVASLTMAASTAFAGAVRSGFTGNTLPRNDDGSTSAVGIGFPVDFFGLQFTSLYVNNNGNVTFDQSLGTYTPFDLTSTQRQIIAPFFADVDTRWAGSPVTYGVGTVAGRPAFGVNWVSVDCYSSDPSRSVRNSFQLVLIERSDTGPDNFDIEFNYDQIQWEAGQASGGDANCLGGFPARVGYSNGSGDPGTFYELPGSGVGGAFLDNGPADTALIHNSLNSDVLGRYIFSARNGVIIPTCPDADGDEICDEDDNCPNVGNPDQVDSDGDGSGDSCDLCPMDAENDADGDGLCAGNDPCPYDADNDADGDGLCGDVDLCSGSSLPEASVPSIDLGVNRWADIDGDGVFDTTSPPGGGRGPRLSFDMQDTGGCTCEQIIVALELGQGHVKFGCSISAMQDWVALVESGDAAGRYPLLADTEAGLEFADEEQGMACNASGNQHAPLWALGFVGLLLWTRRSRRPTHTRAG